jgi:hypothetical protein
MCWTPRSRVRGGYYFGGSLIFKDKVIEDQWWQIHPKLRLVLCDAEWFVRKRGVLPVCTCLLRTEEEQAALYEAGQAASKSSVHCDGRGADWRMVTPSIVAMDLRDYINRKYVYDFARPDKKTLLIHGGTANHLHFQVPPEPDVLHI